MIIGGDETGFNTAKLRFRQYAVGRAEAIWARIR
jgi:hypothetical protein